MYGTTSILYTVFHETDPKLSSGSKFNESRKGEEISPIYWSLENSSIYIDGISNVNFCRFVWNCFCYIAERCFSLDVEKDGRCFHVDISYQVLRYCIVENIVSN